MSAVAAPVNMATHMIIETCGCTASGEIHSAVNATAMPSALATIGRPARSMARNT